jgi:hypothetical protein
MIKIILLLTAKINYKGADIKHVFTHMLCTTKLSTTKDFCIARYRTTILLLRLNMGGRGGGVLACFKVKFCQMLGRAVESDCQFPEHPNWLSHIQKPDTEISGHLNTRGTDKNCMQKKIKSGLNSRNARYHSV